MSEDQHIGLNGKMNGQPQGSYVVSPREILMKYLPFLPWVIASMVIAFTLAYIKVRYTPEVYNVNSTLLIKNENPYGSKAEKFDDILFTESNKDLQDEMQVIRSTSMAKRVIKSLRLELRYYNQGKIRSTEIRAVESPFLIRVVKIKDSASYFGLPVNILSEQDFSINENGSPVHFGQTFETNAGTFILDRTAVSLSQFASNLFYVDYLPADQRATSLVGSLTALPSGESNNILQLNFETENTRLGEEIVNQWMKEYEQAGLEDKKQIAVNALSFIDEQMDTVKFELGGVEKNLLGFREKNKVINSQQQSVQIFTMMSALEKELTEQGVKMQVLDNLIGYIGDTRTPYRQVGTTLGIEEPSLAQQISEYNKLQLQRETLLKSTTRSNPMLINVETGIEKLRLDILQNLKSIRQAYQVSFNNLISRNREFNSEFSQIPAKEKQLLDITRRQKILEELYSFLLQKKLETSISSASTISNVRVIEPARATGFPIRPNKKGIYTIALFLGLLIPIAIIFLMEFLNDKVNSRDDIIKVTDAPIIGEVSHSEEKTPLVVYKTSRKFIGEQFRIIRTNLQYIVPKKDKFVILVTSTVSGEGKSFISTNMAAVMALTGKRTAILEFDIRKPKIMTALGLPKKNGVTNYIIGKTDIDELAVPVSGIENLFIVPCGPIPPNPSELLLDDKLDELMSKLKEKFDIIIIDTAPVGLVSDAVVLGKYADATIYIIRHNYTMKKQLQLLNEIHTSKRLPKLSVVINDINVKGGYGKYYGYGYGQTGYGYGYGTEYFDELKSSPSFLKRLREIFRK